MDKQYEMDLVNRVLTKQKELEHMLEMQACSGQLEYMSARERTDHEFKWRDTQVIIRALESYKKELQNGG